MTDPFGLTPLGIPGVENIFPATVVKVIDPLTIVINRGASHGVAVDKRFMIYGLSDEELIDPETNEPLGLLEIVRGRGKVIHVQEKIATVKSIMTERNTKVIRKKHSGTFVFGLQEETIEEPGEVYTLPFQDVQVGDKAKPI